jgi:hypothetical protein
LAMSLLIDLAITLSSRCSGVCCASARPFEEEPLVERKAAAAAPPVVNTSRRENLFMGRHSLGGTKIPGVRRPWVDAGRGITDLDLPSTRASTGENLNRIEAGVIGQMGDRGQDRFGRQLRGASRTVPR